MMAKYIIVLLISKSQQQTTLQQQQYSGPSRTLSPQRLTVQILQQRIQEQKPLHQAAVDQTYHPITFPSSNEDLVNDRFSPLINNFNHNLVASNNNHRVVETTSINTNFPVASPQAAIPYSDDAYEFIREFAWTLFQGSKIPQQNGNLILSPLLVQMQLSLLRQAATGLTEEEIGHAIGEISPQLMRQLSTQLKSANSVSTHMDLASAIFTANQLKLNNSFLQEANARNIGVIPVNFNSADESSNVINRWVSNATNNKIQNIFKPDDRRGTRTLLANTIFFNGEWRFGFNDVAIEPFYTNDQTSKSVEMMKNIASLRAGKIMLRNGFTGQWVEMPYKGDEYSMVLIVPEQRYYLDEFIRSMRPSDFSEILSNLTSSYKKMVHLSLPKFQAVSSFSVVNVLLKMGIVDLFTQSSQLPYFAVNEPRLRIDDILQQGLLSVDEKGTIAAAATVSHVVTLSLNSVPEEIYFKADQPFLSIVVDKRNKIPIFVSKIYNP